MNRGDNASESWESKYNISTTDLAEEIDSTEDEETQENNSTEDININTLGGDK